MKIRTTFATISGTAITALLLSGCAVELISADGQCAEIVVDSNPDLFFNNLNLDSSGDSSDSTASFEFETTGSYENLYSYFAYPEFPFDLGPDNPFDGIIADEVFAVERYSSSFDVVEGDPHTVYLDEIGLAVFSVGIGAPVAIIAACDAAAYNLTTPTASPNPSTGYPPVVLSDANVAQVYPGYVTDHADVSVSKGVVSAEFPRSQDAPYAVATVIPWLEGYGDVYDATFEQVWWAAGISLESGVDPLQQSDPDLMTKNPTFDFSELDADLTSAWNTGLGVLNLGSVTGAIVLLLSLDLSDELTAQLRYSYHPASFDSNGLLTTSGPQTINYAGPAYNDGQLKGRPGEQVTLTGSNMKVNSVRIGGQNARIVSNSSTQLTIEIPTGLTGGRYNADLGFDGGSVTRQLGATVIDHSAWTKRIAPTQAKVYAKNVVGVGKVRFVVNGSEIAWVNAVDANDPKLRKVGAANYLVRTVNLKAGKNVLEIYVGDTREQRTVYTR